MFQQVCRISKELLTAYPSTDALRAPLRTNGLGDIRPKQAAQSSVVFRQREEGSVSSTSGARGWISTSLVR